MSAAPPYTESGGWSWTDLDDDEETVIKPETSDLPGSLKEEANIEPETSDLPGTFNEEHVKQEPIKQTPPATDDPQQANEPPPRQQKHYAPRTCRICLEEVLPSFEPVPEGITAMLNPAPKVSYISSDPASGRLIRPCKCRGSQKYVHEGCLQEWRHADPSYGRRTYFECPTCKFQYRLERIKWSRWLTSTTLQIALTISIMFATIFVFGFFADPIINLYLDPLDTITTTASGRRMPAIVLEDAEATWGEHFLKGLASLGLLGFIKVFIAMSPWQWWNLRQGGYIGGGGRRATAGRQGGGRERLESLSWTVVIIGVITFLFAVWRWVRAWTLRTLEKAGEKVADVQGDDDEDEEVNHPQTTAAGSSQESSRNRQADTR